MHVLFLTVLIDLIGFGIVIPILPFMAPTLGASHFDIALIIAIYSVFGGIVGPFWGRLSDRIGRKPVLLICLAGAAVSYVMLAFSTTLTMLYVSRALAGVMAGNFGVASAIVADISRPETRARSMGVIGSAFGLGMVAGPFLGGVLAGDGNFVRPALVAAALSTTAIVAGLLLLKESHPPGTRKAHAEHRSQHGNGGPLLKMLRDTGNTLLVAQYFLTNSCHTAISYLFPLWVGAMLGWGAREVGMVFGAQGIAMALLQAGLIGVLARRFGELRLLLTGAGLMVSGFSIAAIAATGPQMLCAFFLAITGGSLCTPVLNALVANRTPPPLRGRMLGTTSSSAAFGRVFGPLLAGALLAQLDFHVAWFSGAMIAALIAAFAISRLRGPAAFVAPAAAVALPPAGDDHGR